MPIDPTASPDVLMVYLAGAGFILAGVSLYMAVRARLRLIDLTAEFRALETTLASRVKWLERRANAVKRRAVPR